MTPSVSLFSPAVLHDTAGGDAALVRELADIFLRIVPPMAARLRDALGAARFSAVADEAHALRSCLSMVGASGLERRCRALESAARRGHPPPDAADAMLCGEIDRLVAEVRAFQHGAANADGGSGHAS